MTDGTTPPAVTYCHKERIDIDDVATFDDATIRRHIIRYDWAVGVLRRRFNRAARVMDCACGTGYGSKMLLSVSNYVLGVDVDHEATEIARQKNGGGLLDFIPWDLSKHHLDILRFDAIVSIETIEHVQDDWAMLARFRDMLKSNGMLVLSTPLRASGSLNDKPANPFHVREYNAQEIAQAVARAGFKDIVVEPENCHLRGFIFLTAVAP